MGTLGLERYTNRLVTACSDAFQQSEIADASEIIIPSRHGRDKSRDVFLEIYPYYANPSLLSFRLTYLWCPITR